MIEFELEQPTPRPIRRRPGHGSFIGCVHIFILPHTLVGIGALGYAIWTSIMTVLIALMGEVVPGEVTERQKSRSGKGGTAYHVHYVYKVDGKDHTGSSQTDAAGFAQLDKGTRVNVRILPAFPEAEPQLLAPGTWNPWLGVAFVWFFALFWNGIVSVFLWTLYVQPWLLRGVVARGTPTPGKIVNKEQRRGKSTTYLVHYEFEAPQVEANGLITGDVEKWKGSMTVRPQDFDAAMIGAEETVLYDPNRPSRSLLYRFTDYEALPG